MLGRESISTHGCSIKGLFILVPSLQLGMPSLPSKGCISPIPQGTLEDLWRQKLFPSADPKIRNEMFPIRLEVTETKDYALLPQNSIRSE